MPQVLDTFLITRRANYPQRAEVYCTFYNVGGRRLFSASDNGIPFEKDFQQQVFLVLFALNSEINTLALINYQGIVMHWGLLHIHLLCDDFARKRPTTVEFRIPEFGSTLLVEPTQAYEKTVDDTCSVFISTCFLGRLDHILCDDTTVRLHDQILIELAGNHLLDLMLQSQRNLSHLLGRQSRRDLIACVCREHCLR